MQRPQQNTLDPYLISRIDRMDSSSFTKGLLLMHLKKGDRTCLCCMQDETKLGVKMKKCSSCISVSYCSLKCQKMDWKEHKSSCKKLKDIRERGKEGVRLSDRLIAIGSQNMPLRDIDWEGMRPEERIAALLPIRPSNLKEWFQMFERFFSNSRTGPFDASFFRLILTTFVENGGDVNFRHRINGWSLMHSAADDEAIEAMKILVEEFGMNVNIKTGINSNGMSTESSPLHICSLFGLADSMKALIDLRANIEQRNKMFETPIMCAGAGVEGAENSQVKMLNHLEKLGADVQAKQWVTGEDGRAEQHNVLDCLIASAWDWTFVHADKSRSYRINEIVSWCEKRGIRESSFSSSKLQALMKKWKE